jgi:hypothetical protein
MATLTLPAAVPAPALVPDSSTTAVLASGCDGYPAGTTGRVSGHRQGCVVFTPDRPETVARWARPRTSMLVPPKFVVTLR